MFHVKWRAKSKRLGLLANGNGSIKDTLTPNRNTDSSLNPKSIAKPTKHMRITVSWDRDNCSKNFCLSLSFSTQYLELVHLQSLWVNIHIIDPIILALKLAQPKMSLWLLNTQLNVRIYVQSSWNFVACVFWPFNFCSKLFTAQSSEKVWKKKHEKNLKYLEL